MDAKADRTGLAPGSDATGGEPKGSAFRHSVRSIWLVLGLVLVGLLGAVLVLHNARSSSPIASAQNLYPHGPLTVQTAGPALLRLRPGSVQGTNLASTVGIPLAQAMLEATGNGSSPSVFSGRISVRPDRSGAGFLVSVTLPVRLRKLERTGEIRLGWLPGSSNLNNGTLSVTARSGRVYGLHMNPKTHQATFLYDLARSDKNVASLNWNANAALQQTDGSDPFS